MSIYVFFSVNYTMSFTFSLSKTNYYINEILPYIVGKLSFNQLTVKNHDYFSRLSSCRNWRSYRAHCIVGHTLAAVVRMVWYLWMWMRSNRNQTPISEKHPYFMHHFMLCALMILAERYVAIQGIQ